MTVRHRFFIAFNSLLEYSVILSSLGLLMDRRIAERDDDIFAEVARVAALTAVGLLTAELVELEIISFGEERLGSVRLGEGKGSETGEELVNV